MLIDAWAQSRLMVCAQVETGIKNELRMSKVLETAWGKPEKAGIELRLLILPLDFQFGLIEASPLTLLHVNASVGQKGDAFVFK